MQLKTIAGQITASRSDEVTISWENVSKPRNIPQIVSDSNEAVALPTLKLSVIQNVFYLFFCLDFFFLY